ncbi:FGGY-family carbohydrate kinase [Guyparkeria hydrothermalis]|uniref:FGGY-family carbohydrate kinase n=1 Tax=Guyparkeria hydrothermalis TaxID=923 RepID=UPI002021E4B6|nr:FGGY-family carbohydrate kinase [Guyparkeria hydrothermalis]MCL7745054.1 FGGY-family carbohydrate kinase [Guyparkeria hydrothermalis]
MTDRNARTLGIDVGTSGLRIAALGPDGDCLCLEKADWPVAPVETTHEQDPSGWWQAFDALMQTLGADGRLREVRAIAFAGTSGTVLTVNEDGTPEGPALMYDDPRGQKQRVALRQLDIDPDAQIDALARWRWLVEARGQHGRPVSQADWFVYRLAGKHVSDSNNALKWGFDPVAECWPTALTERFGNALPSVQRAGTPIGPLHDDWCRRWSLPGEVQMAAGTTDSMAALWASGANNEGDGVTSLGSTLALKLISDQPVADAASGVYSHRFGERFAVSGASNTGGRALAAHFSADEIERLSRDIDPERPDTLGYWPLAGRGERFPVVAPNMGPRLTPRPADPAAFLAGLLRGIARIEAIGYRRFAELGGSPLRRVLSSGGGAQNAVFRAIRARALGVPVTVAEHTEAAVGAARLAEHSLHDAPTTGTTR